LLDDQNMVNAIADGGWANGTVSIGWAIPFSEIHFQPVGAGNVQTRLQQLGNQNPADAPVFSATFDAGGVEQVTVKESTPQSSASSPSSPSTPSMRWRGTIRLMTGPQDEGKTFDYVILYNGPKKLASVKLYGDGLSTLFGNTIMRAITAYGSDQKNYLHMLAPSSVACDDMSGPNVTPAVTSMSDSISSLMEVLPGLAYPNGAAGTDGAFQGEQTVQSINTRHYTFDPDILNSGNNNTPGVTYLSTDVWTASDDNRLVQVMTLAQVQALKLGTLPFTGYVQLTGQFADADENLSIPIPEECTSPGSKAQVPLTDSDQARQIMTTVNQAEIAVLKNGLSDTGYNWFQGLYRYELENQVNDLIDQGLHEDWEFDANKSYVRNVTALGSSSYALNTCEYWRWQRKDAQGQIVDQSEDFPQYGLGAQTIIVTFMDVGAGEYPYVTEEYSYADKGACK
jgi:hypothetical protein